MKILLLAALLCFAVQATKVVASEKEVVVSAFMENAKTSEFGQTILGTIELEIENGSPGDVLRDMLDKIRTGQESEMKTADETHAKIQGQCKVVLEQLKSEIKTQARKVIKAKDTLKKAAARLGWSENQLELQKRQQKELIEGQAKIKSIREKEANRYTKKINEINAALGILNEGKLKLEKQFAGAKSFIEVKNSFQGYVQTMLLQIEKPEYLGRGYVALISFLSELVQAPVVAKKGGVDKVLNLIQKIIDELQNAKNVETKAEDERIANYKELVEIYESGLKQVAKRIDELNGDISQYTDTVTMSKRSILESTKTIRLKGRERRKEKQKCKLEQRSYEKESKERKAELSLTQEAVKLITENLDAFQKLVLENSKANIAAKYGKL